MRFRGVPVVLLALSVSACGYRPHISSQVAPDSIRQVSVGMTRPEVESILGPPLRERRADNEARPELIDGQRFQSSTPSYTSGRSQAGSE